MTWLLFSVLYNYFHGSEYMSRFKFIGEYKSDGKVCNIYKDKITGIYYKIDDGVVKRVFSDDVKIADKITNCKIKNRKNKKDI